MSVKRRIGVIVGLSAMASLALQSTAYANFYGTITDAKEGAESRTWFDWDYTEVEFYKCESAHHQSVQVLLRHVKDYQPDPNMGTKVFTACFHNDDVSQGHWTGLDTGNYYFELGAIDSGDSSTIDVGTYYVDTTKAD